ncbi:MAG: CHAT domain-containing protein [Phormidesmis sp.]
MRKLLILTANPIGSDQLRLAAEIRDISEGLKRSHHRDNFKIIPHLAVRPRDLRRAVVEEAPQMVHFSGHGEGKAGLYFEDEAGNPKLVTGKVLSGLFDLIAEKTQVECVVLNRCYSSAQAEAIAQHVPYVVGMQQAVGDKAAIEFSVGFYDAIWNGESVEFAFKSGKVAAQFSSI